MVDQRSSFRTAMARRTRLCSQVRQILADNIDVKAKRALLRDIKPSNLLIALTPFPHTLITDFGSAAAFEMNTASFSSASSSRRLPHSSCLYPAGTPEYIAPEVLSMWEDACCFEEDLLFEPEGDGTGHISSKRYGSEVDLWSLGVVL